MQQANNTPFVKPFDTPQANYLYDVNTSRILQVDKATQEIAPRYAPERQEKIRCDYAGQYTDEQIQGTFDAIDTAQDDGLLLSNRPVDLWSWSEEEIRERLADKVAHMSLCLTEHCNLRCEYCIYSGSYANSRCHSTRRMSRETLDQAIDLLYRHSAESEKVSIGFYGGEPLLEWKLLEHAVTRWEEMYGKRGKQARFNITTNGLLLNDHRLDFLAEHWVQTLVSFDGPKELHDRYRIDVKGEGSFERIYANLKKARERYPEYFRKKVRLNVIVAPPYDLKALIRFFEENEVLQGVPFRISNVNGAENAFLRRFTKEQKSRGQFESLRQHYIDRITAGKPPGNLLRQMFEGGMREVHFRKCYDLVTDKFPLNGICVPGASKTFVDVHGNIHICEKLNPVEPIGNVRSGFDVEKIVKMVRGYQEKSVQECLGCWAVRFCRLCFTSVIDERFDMDLRQQHCDGMRRNVLYDLKLYCEIRERREAAFETLLPNKPQTQSENQPPKAQAGP